MYSGGAKWTSGTDACIFLPATRCVGEAERPDGQVSRVLVGTSQDERTETRIRAAFPQLVESGVVTVFTKACPPSFTATDMQDRRMTPYPDDGCAKVDRAWREGMPLRNLQTPFRDGGTLHAYVYEWNPATRTWGRTPEHSPKEIATLLRPVLEAAVDMVPDAGPWIIHADCHLDNVLLYGTKPTATLADWGRTVIIEDPTSLKSIQAGLSEWLTPLWDPGSPLTPGTQVFKMVLEGWGKYPQHPAPILAHVQSLFPESGIVEDATLTTARNAIRAWLPFVLLKQCFDGMNAHSLLTTTSQAALRMEVRRLLDTVDAPSPREEDTGSLSTSPSSTGGMYWPVKYHRGLTRKQNAQRKRSATRRAKMSWKNPKAYVPWKSDTGAKTRRSSYSSKFHAKYPGVTTLSEIAKATGIPKSTLQTVYDRGMAAWRTGHRPGASQHAWGMARVHSFVLKGKTYRTADADLAKTSRGKE